MAPTNVMPTRLPRFPEPSSTLELSCHQAPTLSLVYSIVFSHNLVPPRTSHVLILCFLCYPVSLSLYTSPCCVPFHNFQYPQLLAMLSTSYIRLSFMYVFNMFEYQL